MCHFSGCAFWSGCSILLPYHPARECQLSALSHEQTGFSHGSSICSGSTKQRSADTLRRESHGALGTIHRETEGEEGRTEGHRRQETARPHGSPSQPETGIGTQRRG